MIDFARLKSNLKTSGLQETNQALFQIINQLIEFIQQFQVGTNDSITNLESNLSETINNITNNSTGGSVGMMGMDGIDGEEGISIPGPMGSRGPQGIQGIPGTPGGPAGPMGVAGPPGIDGEEGIENFIFLPGSGGSGGSGSGGNVTTTGAYGSEPSGSEGDLYFTNNSPYLERKNASIWVPWGPIYPFTKPVDGDFAWINQGGASKVTTTGGVFLRAPLNATGNPSLRIRKKAAPSTPYTIVAGILPAIVSLNYQSCGLLFRNNGAGTIETLEFSAATSVNSALVVNRYSSATVYSSTPLNRGQGHAMGIVWLKIADDGTDRIYSYSTDGQNFITIFTVTRTTFLTADEVGFFVNEQTNTVESGVSLLSWKEG